MRVALVFHIVLLSVAALVAYQAGDETDKRDDDTLPALFDAPEEAATAVRFVSEGLDATMSKAGEGKDVSWLVKLTREVKTRPDAASPKNAKKNAEAKDEASADAGPAAAATEVKTFRFPAARRVTRSIEKLFPLVPKRNLGPVDSARLEKMGLGDDAGSLELSAGAKRVVFRLGGNMYGGAGRYLQNDAGDVFLIENGAVSGFNGDEAKLSERRLEPSPLADVTAASFEVGDKVRAYTHEKRKDAKDDFFAPVELPEEQSEPAMEAVTLLRRLKAKRFVDAEGLSPEVRVVLARFRLAHAEGKERLGEVWGKDDAFGYARIGEWVFALAMPDHAALEKALNEAVAAPSPAKAP